MRLWSMTALEYPVDANENKAESDALFARGGRDRVLVFDEPHAASPAPPRVFADGLVMPLGVQPFRDVFSAYELLAYLSVRPPRLGFRCCEVPVVRAYPANAPVPTKIAGWRGSLGLLQTLLAALRGDFNPTP